MFGSEGHGKIKDDLIVLLKEEREELNVFMLFLYMYRKCACCTTGWIYFPGIKEIEKSTSVQK